MVREDHERHIDEMRERVKVHVETFHQVMRERDIAIGQLKELGYEFGQKIEPCYKKVISLECAKKQIGRWIGYIDQDMINRICMSLDALPPVTPSRRKGHWIIKDRYYHDTVTAECSECGREVEIPTCMSELMYKGCPYCLAEMESENELRASRDVIT